MTLRTPNGIFRVNNAENRDYGGALGEALVLRLSAARRKAAVFLKGRGGGGKQQSSHELPWGQRERRQEHRLRHPPNGLIYHGRDGMQILHLYSGYSIARVMPLAEDTYYDDVNDDFLIESVASRIAVTTQTYGELGVSTSLDCSGVIRTGLPIGVHVLLNITICDTPGIFSRSTLLQQFMRGDAESSVTSRTVNKLELLGSYNSVSQTSVAVPPIVVQLQRNRGFGVTEVERRAVFMMDSGLVTCIDLSRRRVAWRAFAHADFTLSDERHPHLSPYAISQAMRDDDPEYIGGGVQRYDVTTPYVIAVGDNTMTVLHSQDGSVAQMVPIPGAPVGPVIVVDFNGDGVNDVLLVTTHGVYGFVGAVQVRSTSVAGLLAGMTGVLLFLFVTREFDLMEQVEKVYNSWLAAEEEEEEGVDEDAEAGVRGGGGDMPFWEG